MATISLEDGLSFMPLIRSLFSVMNSVRHTDAAKQKMKVLGVARQFGFLGKYLLVPLLWSVIPFPVAFPLSGVVLYAIFLLEARAASFYRIQSNLKAPEELFQALDKYAPMWLNPEFDPDLRDDSNAISEYKAHKNLDKLIIQSGFEDSNEVELPERRTAIPTETTFYQSCVFLYQTFNYNMKALASLWRVSVKWIRVRFYKLNDITADSVAEMMINSELGIFSHVEACNYKEEEGIMITFDRGGFALPYDHLRNRFDNRLRICVFIPDLWEGHRNKLTKKKRKSFRSSRCQKDVTTCVRGAKLIEFRMRNFSDAGAKFTEIRDMRDIIHVLAVLNATVCHPIVHSLNDHYTVKVNFAESRGSLSRGLSKIVRYGNSFNDLAHFACPCDERKERLVVKDCCSLQ